MEAFNLKKLLSSPFTGLYWTKTVMFLLGGTGILVIGFAVYKAYFKRPEPTQAIKAEAGSNVTVIQQNNRKRYFIPFMEGGIEQPTNDDWHTFIRAGLRFEF